MIRTKQLFVFSTLCFSTPALGALFTSELPIPFEVFVQKKFLVFKKHRKSWKKEFNSPFYKTCEKSRVVLFIFRAYYFRAELFVQLITRSTPMLPSEAHWVHTQITCLRSVGELVAPRCKFGYLAKLSDFHITVHISWWYCLSRLWGKIENVRWDKI